LRLRLGLYDYDQHYNNEDSTSKQNCYLGASLNQFSRNNYRAWII